MLFCKDDFDISEHTEFDMALNTKSTQNFNLGMANSLGKGKIWIQTCSKIAEGFDEYIYIYIYIYI